MNWLHCAFTTLLFPAAITVSHVPINVQKINVKPQQDATCGYWSIINAQSIQKLFTDNIPVTSANIIKTSSVFEPLLKEKKTYGEVLDIEQIYELCSSSEIIFLAVNPHTQQIYFPLLQSQELDLLQKQFHQSKRSLIQFICNTGGHWILFSLVKENGHADLLYLDSANPSELSATAHKLADYILKRFSPSKQNS